MEKEKYWKTHALLVQELFVLEACGFGWIPKKHAVSPAQFPPVGSWDVGRSQDANVYSNIRELKHKEVVGIFSHCPMVYVRQNPIYLGNAILKMACRHDREEIAQRIRLNLMGRLCWECVDSPGLQVYLDRRFEDRPWRSILRMRMAQISSNCSSVYYTRSHKWNLNIPKIYHSCQVMLKKSSLKL